MFYMFIHFPLLLKGLSHFEIICKKIAGAVKAVLSLFLLLKYCVWWFSSVSVQNGTSPLGIAKRLGYISVIDVLKLVTEESVSAVSKHILPGSHGYTRAQRSDTPWLRCSMKQFPCRDQAQLHQLTFNLTSTLHLSLLVLFTDHYREASDEFSWDGGWDTGRLRGWR